MHIRHALKILRPTGMQHRLSSCLAMVIPNTTALAAQAFCKVTGPCQVQQLGAGKLHWRMAGSETNIGIPRWWRRLVVHGDFNPTGCLRHELHLL